MRFFSTVVIVLFSVINTHYAKAQQTLEGKYLVSINKAGEHNTKAMLMEAKDGVIEIMNANKQPDFPFAKIQLKPGIASIEFNPMLEQYESDFEVETLPQGNMLLHNETVELMFKPYESNETDNKAMGVLGKWKWQEGNNKIALHFELPDIVHIEVGKQYESTATACYWYANVNGEDITITATLFFDKFVGVLKQIHVKDGNLQFEHKGKHYIMTPE